MKPFVCSSSTKRAPRPPLEDAERAYWLAKVAAAGVTLGSTLAV